MTGYTLVEIAQILGATILGEHEGWVTDFSIDTRSIGIHNRTLFFLPSKQIWQMVTTMCK